MKKMGIVFLAMAGLICIHLFAQNDLENTEYNKWYNEATRLYNLDEPSESTDSLALDLFMRCAVFASGRYDKHNLAVDCFIKAGNIHQTYQRFNQSNQCYRQSLIINMAYLKDDRLTYEALLYLGSSYYFSNVIDSAQFYFEEASTIALSYKGALPELERLYNSLGAIYFESANYLQAKNYFEKALLITESTTEDYAETYVGIYSNIANCMMRQNFFDSALRIYKMLSTYETKKEVTDIILQNTAHAYYELGYYDSALTIYRQLPLENAQNRIRALNDIGRIFMRQKEWQKAEVILDSAIEVNKKISTYIKNKEEGLAYLYRGQLAAEQGFTDEAITWCNQALGEVHLDFKWKRAEDLPADVSKSVSPIVLFEILRTKANLLFKKYNASGKEQFLAASMLAYRKTILTAKLIKKNFDNDEATIFFTKNYRLFYLEAMKAAFEATGKNIKYIDDYLFVVENYKGQSLYHNLQNIQLKSNAQIPDSIKRREKVLKQLLAFYTSRISSNVEEKDAIYLQKRLIELQVSLSRLQKEYEQDSSYNLYRYQTEENESTLGFIQSSIDHQTALINYIEDDSVIYTLAINKNKFLLKKIEANKYFKNELFNYLQELNQHTEGLRFQGFESSNRLYKTLISPLEKITNGCSKWVIIPNDYLYYLPFEGLITKAGTKDYVVLSKEISYHYSFALLLVKNTHHKRDASEKGVLAFAPFIASDQNITRSNLDILPSSAEEINLPGQDIYKAVSATKRKFLSEATKFPLIHLATHASLGTDSLSNWIQFYPDDTIANNNKLFLHEIYNLNLHRAELVILSACESGSGVTVSGEGLLSLSRAFLYAGSDGIIATLWKTEDRVTSYLMKQLHTYLKKEYPPEKALQLAKKDLINNKDFGFQYKTPNYWSNFIYIGKIKPIDNSKGYIKWFLIIFVLGAVSALFIYRKDIYELILQFKIIFPFYFLKK